ncbi:MAG: Sua5/YciO/YrdC/YwlC family protein [Planctomycetota bacterium]
MPGALHDLKTADRARLLRDVVEALRAGGLCVLPTETVYGLAVLPSHAAAVAKCRALKGRGGEQPFTWHLARSSDVRHLATTIPANVERLLARYWPGPLTVILPGRDGGDVGLRVPAHDFTRDVIAACGEGLWLSSVNRHGEEPLRDGPAIARAFGGELAMIVDDGPSPIGLASTIVRATGPRLEVLREGILTGPEVLHTAATLVLFVCTGNTCRSPLAAGWAAELTAQKLGVRRDDVLAHGYWFASAGTSTLDGMPASDGSLAAGAEAKLGLERHQSQALTPELVERAARIYCLAQGHRRAILAEHPDAASKVAMLRPDGLDVADPYGRELPVYRRTRDEIRAAVAARLPEWLA